ncbi:pilus assembly protein [Janibacter sp. CX7]|nr:pilus assembly protein [Janibacter sp. CX7]
MTSALLLFVFLGVFQLGLTLHVRNTLISCASEGARYGAREGSTPQEGAGRTEDLIGRSLSARFAGDVTARVDTTAAALDATDDSAKLVYDRGLGTDLPLDDATVQASAADHLAGRSRPHGLESWKVASGTGSPDGRTAVVRLSGEADLPLIGGLLRTISGSVTVTVESRARAGVTPG